MSAYIAELRRQTAEAAACEPQQTQSASLRDRFLAWHGGLPPLTRDRPFSMKEFEVALKTQGKYISPILLDLGWQRIRVWASTGQYHRYWQPPSKQEF